jgi:anti-sigma-K factor RskA
LLCVRIEKETTETPLPSRSVIPFPDKTIPTLRTPTSTPSAFSRTFLPWAVAAVLLIALAYALTAWQKDRRSLQASIEANKKEAVVLAQQENAALKEQLDNESARSSELAQINAVLRSPQRRIIPLEGQTPAPDSSAKVYWDLQANTWVVTADLPPAPEGKVYQLWFVTPTAKISAGLITPNKAGHGFAVVRFASSVTPLAAAAITLEPAGGSQQPTMPIYALGKVS